MIDCLVRYQQFYVQGAHQQPILNKPHARYAKRLEFIRIFFSIGFLRIERLCLQCSLLDIFGNLDYRN